MKKLISLLLLAAVMMTAASCGSGGETGVETTAEEIETSTQKNPESTTAPETTEEVETTAETTEEITETTEETTAETTEAAPVEPEFVNPLTGLASETDYSERRPVAIMINNIKPAMPQEGISYADIMYECVVEGQQTRLMMLSMDYENLPVIGSVRSSREYYLDFAANHDAIYVHAGGSEQAYTEMKQRRVDHLDGVNMSIPGMFYRDQWRRENIGYEHSLMTDGERIVEGIDYVGSRTELKSSFTSPINFVPFDEIKVPSDGTCETLTVKYSGVHHPHYEYDTDEGVYYRWQFIDEAHMDNTANVQLSYTNIILLYLKTSNTHDEYNHMDVITTGSGEGYYISMGGYETVKWEKNSEDSPIKLTNAAGEELLINRGNTIFQICTTAMESTTEMQ